MSSPLRRSVYRSGGYLAVRQGVGLVLTAAGVLLLTRFLGPATYGLYAAALGIQVVVQTLAGWGVGTYLVRLEGEDRHEAYDHAWSFLIVAGTAALVCAALAAPLLERFTRLEDLTAPALALFAAMPLQLAASVPMAKLERALDFRNVARIELAGQAGFCLVAGPLAVFGFGVWAPVAGFWTQHLIQTAGYFRLARYRPRWSWSVDATRDMLRFGSGYSASLWLWQARRLVNPLIVGRYLGSEAVAFVAVATQIALQLGFITGAAWRLSTAALARLQTDATRTAGAVREGMHLQALAVGPPLVAFGWIGGWLVPVLLGQEWAPLMRVYPAVALAHLTASVFLLLSSALYVRDRSWEVGAFHLANALLLTLGALLFVPRYGLIGYAAAELGALLSFGVLHLIARRVITDLSYGAAGAVCGALAVALMVPRAPWVGVLLIGGVLALRPTRSLITGLWQEIRGHAYES